jgi:predicted transcriptional regulator
MEGTMADTQNEVLEQLQQEIGILKQERDALKSYIDALKRKYDASNVEHDALNLIVSASKQELGALKIMYDALKQDYGVLKENNGALKSNVDILKSELDATKTERDALKAEIGVLKGIPVIPKQQKLTNYIRDHQQEYFGKEKMTDVIRGHLAEIVSCIAEKQQVQLSGILQAISLEYRTIQRYLRTLREAGCIEFKGSRRNGVFVITELGKKLLNEADAS